MESTTNTNDIHELIEVLLGINPEEGQKGEGGGGAHTCSSLGHMATPERQVVQWGGQCPQMGPPIWWRVLWQSGPPDQGGVVAYCH